MVYWTHKGLTRILVLEYRPYLVDPWVSHGPWSPASPRRIRWPYRTSWTGAGDGWVARRWMLGWDDSCRIQRPRGGVTLPKNVWVYKGRLLTTKNLRIIWRILTGGVGWIWLNAHESWGGCLKSCWLWRINDLAFLYIICRSQVSCNVCMATPVKFFGMARRRKGVSRIQELPKRVVTWAKRIRQDIFPPPQKSVPHHIRKRTPLQYVYNIRIHHHFAT